MVVRITIKLMALKTTTLHKVDSPNRMELQNLKGVNVPGDSLSLALILKYNTHYLADITSSVNYLNDDISRTKLKIWTV
jgi:hypothetical protein